MKSIGLKIKKKKIWTTVKRAKKKPTNNKKQAISHVINSNKIFNNKVCEKLLYYYTIWKWLTSVCVSDHYSLKYLQGIYQKNYFEKHVSKALQDLQNSALKIWKLKLS